MPPSFHDADAVAEVISWLSTHTTATGLLGDPPSLSGIAEAPWPHLVVIEGLNGDLRNLTWEHEQEVTLELLSSPTTGPGKAALRNQLLQLAAAVMELPDRAVGPTSVVVSNVKPSGGLRFQKLTTGQLSYQLSLLVTVHPPLSS
jgi:hypothetical protein